MSMTKEQLKGWREHMEWTKAEAAERLGMTQNAYRAMENGDARISRRTALACAALYIGGEKIAQPWMH